MPDLSYVTHGPLAPVRGRLIELAALRRRVRIDRSPLVAEPDTGFLVDVGDHLGLLAVEREFRIVEFLVFRLDDVRSVRANWIDRFHADVVRSRDTLRRLVPDVRLYLRDLPALFEGLLRSDLSVSVEKEHIVAWDLQRGTIEGLTRRQILVRTDRERRPDTERFEWLPIDAITCVRLAAAEILSGAEA